MNLLKYRTIFFQSKNSKGVLSLLTGGMISRIVTGIGAILLAGYYGSESYGVYSVFLSYIMILPIISSMRLDNIIVLQKGAKEIRNLFSGVLIIILILNVFLITLLSIIKITQIVSIEVPYKILVLIGIGSVLTGWNFSQNFLFTKYKLFKQIATSFVISSVFSVLFQGVFYFLGWIENGLIYGWLVGLFFSFLYNVSVSKSRMDKVNVPMFRQSVKENIEIVKYTFPSESINAIANNIMPILIIMYFSQSEVGVYAMANKILVLPLVLLSSAISRVYFQKAVSLYGVDNRRLQKTTYKIILLSVVSIFIFVILINTLGIYLLELFFGISWEGLRAYILALSIWIIARSAVNPISDLIIVLKKNQYALFFNIYLLLVNFVVIYYGVHRSSLLTGIWLFSIFSAGGYLLLLWVSLYNLKKDVRKQHA